MQTILNRKRPLVVVPYHVAFSSVSRMPIAIRYGHDWWITVIVEAVIEMDANGRRG